MQLFTTNRTGLDSSRRRATSQEVANSGGDCGPVRVRLHPTSGRENTEIEATVAACSCCMCAQHKRRLAAVSEPRCLLLKVSGKFVPCGWPVSTTEHTASRVLNHEIFLFPFWFCFDAVGHVLLHLQSRKNNCLNQYRFVCGT
ncbi:hypothetical protein MTO96_009603 [Rhipicephalus appendiculatus]